MGVSARNSLSDQVGDQRLKIRNEQFPGGLQTAGTGTLGETIVTIELELGGTIIVSTFT